MVNFYTRFLIITHRQYFVHIDSNFSSYPVAKYGVPQGSALGSILFNLCVAQMSSITRKGNCIQYADDSTMYRSNKINQNDTWIEGLEKGITSTAKW